MRNSEWTITYENKGMSKRKEGAGMREGSNNNLFSNQKIREHNIDVLII